jgi:hypothetical protein
MLLTQGAGLVCKRVVVGTMRHNAMYGICCIVGVCLSKPLRGGLRCRSEARPRDPSLGGPNKTCM